MNPTTKKVILGMAALCAVACLSVPFRAVLGINVTDQQAVAALALAFAAVIAFAATTN